MSRLTTSGRPVPSDFHGMTAADLMSPHLVSLRFDATVAEATALLVDRGINAAPVIDEAGHPIGVLSHTDLLAHDRERYGRTEPDSARARDLMTPAVFAVSPGTPAVQVIEDMLAHRVHRLFVLDDSRTLVGVVTALDILRHIRPD